MVRGIFKFTSVGDGVLKLEEPTTSCGCTVAKLQLEVLQPGEKGELAFSLEMPSARATLEKHITLASNDPQNPKVELTVKADYIPIYEYTPLLIRLDVRSGGTTNIPVEIRRTDGKKLHINKIETSKPWITAKLEERSTTDQQSARVLVNLKPEGEPRNLSDYIRIFGEDLDQPVISLFISGRIVGEVSVSPEMLYWAIIDPDNLKKEESDNLKTRRLAAKSTVPMRSFELRDPRSTIESLKVEVIRKENGESYDVIASLSDIPHKTVHGTIKIETNIPGQPRLEIPVTIAILHRDPGP